MFSLWFFCRCLLRECYQTTDTYMYTCTHIYSPCPRSVGTKDKVFMNHIWTTCRERVLSLLWLNFWFSSYESNCSLSAKACSRGVASCVKCTVARDFNMLRCFRIWEVYCGVRFHVAFRHYNVCGIYMQVPFQPQQRLEQHRGESARLLAGADWNSECSEE